MSWQQQLASYTPHTTSECPVTVLTRVLVFLLVIVRLPPCQDVLSLRLLLRIPVLQHRRQSKSGGSQSQSWLLQDATRQQG
jgi:hypothetical protein